MRSLGSDQKTPFLTEKEETRVETPPPPLRAQLRNRYLLSPLSVTTVPNLEQS